MVENNGFKILEGTDLTTGYRVSINNNAEKTVEHIVNRDNPHEVTAAQVGASNPNLLINGDFQVWQRGESRENFLYLYTADRWLLNSLEPIPKVERVPEGMRITPKSGHVVVVQKMEENWWNRLVGKVVTLSYSINGKIGSDTFIAEEGPVYGKAIAWGTNGATTPFTINWLKLEFGETATPFVPRPYAEELALCQRYYERFEVYYGLYMDMGSVILSNIHYGRKRTAPSLKYKGWSGLVNNIHYQPLGSGGSDFETDVSITNVDNAQFRLKNRADITVVPAVGNVIVRELEIDAEFY